MAVIFNPPPSHSTINRVRLQVGKEWIERSTSGEWDAGEVRNIVLEMLEQMDFGEEPND